MMRPIVVIESPYAGDVERNVQYARACVRDSLIRGEAPFASHLLYTQEGVLRDGAPEERAVGIDAGHEFFRVCMFVAFYTDLGITPGMELALSRVTRWKIPQVMRQLGRPWMLSDPWSSDGL